MPTDIRIVTAPAEQRQIARVLDFEAKLAPYINWDSIATQARELGAHIDVRIHDKGATTVTLFWSYNPDEV